MFIVVMLALTLIGVPAAGMCAPDGDPIDPIVNPGDGNPPPSMWPNCWTCQYTYALFIPINAECEHASISTGMRGPCQVVHTSHLTADCHYGGAGPCSVPLQSVTPYTEIFDRPEVFIR